MKLIAVIFGTVLCAALYHQVFGDGVTKCYTCKLTDVTCENETEIKCNETYGAKPDTKWVCLTQTLTTGDVTFKNKGCVANDTAEKTCKAYYDSYPEGADISCTYCNEDLCNSAGIYSISLLLLSSLFLLTKLL